MNIQSMLGLRKAKRRSSPLEGLPAFRAQQAETALPQSARREWWLWLSALFVTALSALAFLLTSFRSLFLHSNHFYEIRADQARWGILCLLLLFNGWLLYRQRFFRRQRRQLTHQGDAPEASSDEIFDPSGVDPVTGLYTRAFVEQQLGKEIARARRQNTSLSIAPIHLDDFTQLNERYGLSPTGPAVKELARRLRKARRGSHFAARLHGRQFLP